MYLEYSPEPGCPSKSQLLGQVRRRTSLARFAARPYGFDVYRVTVAPSDGEQHGRLEVRSASGATSVREITGASCVEVVSALALTVAMTIDPHAAEQTAQPQAPSSSLPLRPASTPAVPAWSLALDIGASGSLITALAPGSTPMLRAHLEQRIEGSHRIWLRMGGAYADSGREPVAPGSAKFVFWGGTFDGCYAPWGARLQMQAAACVGLLWGRLSVEGLDIPAPRTSHESWIALEALARGRWDVARWLALHAEGGLLLPITRRTYVFDSPHTVAWQAPAVGIVLGLGVSVPVL